jgi:hypothetical protein
VSDDDIPDVSEAGATRRKLLFGAGAVAAGAGLLTAVAAPQKAQAVAKDASYYSSEPSRYVDTRWRGDRIVGGETRTLSVFRELSYFAFACNVTVVDTQGTGYLAIYNADYESRPGPFSTINWQGAGKVVANFHIMDLGETGAKVYCSGGSTTSTHFIIDVIGYFYAIPEAAPAPPEFTQWEQKARRRVEAEQREG